MPLPRALREDGTTLSTMLISGNVVEFIRPVPASGTLELKDCGKTIESRLCFLNTAAKGLAVVGALGEILALVQGLGRVRQRRRRDTAYGGDEAVANEGVLNQRGAQLLQPAPPRTASAAPARAAGHATPGRTAPGACP